MAKPRVNHFSLFIPIRLVGFDSSIYNQKSMSNLPPDKLNRSNDQPRILIWGLIVSLLLHILVVLFFVFFPQQESLKLKQPPTTVVRLIDLKEKPKKPQPDKKSEFEIDQPPVKTPPKKPVESFRKAEQDQKVEKEQAPKGEDARDQTAKLPAAQRPQPQKPQPQVQPEKPQKATPPKKEVKAQPQPKTPVKSLRKTEKKPVEDREKPQKAEQPTEEKPTTTPKPPLTMEQLLPNANTLNQVTRGSQAERNRRKKRKDVEIGDEVWLTTQSNMLASFFRRLSDKIDLVWNYPAQAARAGHQGTVGVLIIINRKGELLEVKLLRSSGSGILDSEAVRAIHQASPFGPLTKRYPHEILKIHANFTYKLGGGRFIYGR